MFCPNCGSNYLENIEFCIKCGVRLEAKINDLEENVRCPYCGVMVSTIEPKCQNCGAFLDKPTRTYPDKAAISEFLREIPGELKKFRWDDSFVRTNLVIIVGMMGMVIIIMLIMNYL